MINLNKDEDYFIEENISSKQDNSQSWYEICIL